MFEKYNEKARRSLFFARYEASKLGSRVIHSEHVLLGLLREGEQTFTEILRAFRVKPEDVRREIEGERVFVERISSTSELPLSENSKKTLAYASHEAESMLHDFVGCEHLLIGLLRVDKSTAAKLLTRQGLDLDRVRELVADLVLERENTPQTPFLDEYTTDLTFLAAQGAFDPLVGREGILERLIETICLRGRNNPLLVGEIGSGRTAIVHALAERIIQGQVPLGLLGKRILEIDVTSVVAGTKYRGQFEERVKGIVKELRENTHGLIFVNDLHVFFGEGSATSKLGAGVMFSPHLVTGEIQCIGATTPAGFSEHLQDNQVVRHHFFQVEVSEPSPETTLQILQGLRGRYETHHGVTYTDDAVRAALEISQEHIADRVLPEKAIYLLDASGAKLRASTPAPEHDRKARGQVQSTSDRLRRAIAEADFEQAAKLHGKLKKLQLRLARKQRGQDQARTGDDPLVVTREVVAEVASVYSQGLSTSSAVVARGFESPTAIAALTERLTALEQELRSMRSRADPLAPLVFLSYAREDYDRASALYEELTGRGIKAWMDKKDMLGGKRWRSELKMMIKKADLILICLSRNAVRKRGFIQEEMQMALEVARQRPQGDISVVPIRLEPELDEDAVPVELAELHFIDLFEEGAIERVVASIGYQLERLGEDEASS